MLFFRQLVHLLPRGIAWRMTVDKPLRRLLQGMSQASQATRDYIDAVFFDLLPDTTRELDRWEDTLGLVAGATDSARRIAYAAVLSAQGGQSPRYLQDVVQAAGFPLYVHEWWWPVTVYRAKGVLLVTHSGDVPFQGGELVKIGTGPAQRQFRVTAVTPSVPGQHDLTIEAIGPNVDASFEFAAGSIALDAGTDIPGGSYDTPTTIASGGITRIELGAPWPRNPLDYADQPQIGTVQCGAEFAQCTATNTPPPDPLPGPLFDLYPQCNRFLRNDTKYLVNLNLTQDAPPPIPADAPPFQHWPYFLYVGGASFGDVVEIPAARRDELERLLLKLRPLHQWIVTLVKYV